MRLKSSSQSDRRSSSASSMIVYLIIVSKSKLQVTGIWIPLLDAAKRQNVRLLHEIKQPSRSSDKNITALLEFVTLSTNRSATIHNARTQHRPVAETTSLIEDLSRQLTGRSHDEHQRLSTNRVRNRVISSAQVGTGSSQLLRLAHQLRQDGDEEGGGLARTWYTSSIYISLSYSLFS